MDKFFKKLFSEKPSYLLVLEIKNEYFLKVYSYFHRMKLMYLLMLTQLLMQYLI